MKCYNETLKINPNYEMAWCNKALDLRKLGRYEDSIACLNEVLKINPDYMKAWRSRILAIGELDRYKDAARCVDKTLKINPKDEEVVMLKNYFSQQLSK